ncbi:hypothetical protein Dimus_020737 [Dionaea muscipula]
MESLFVEGHHSCLGGPRRRPAHRTCCCNRWPPQATSSSPIVAVEIRVSSILYLSVYHVIDRDLDSLDDAGGVMPTTAAALADASSPLAKLLAVVVTVKRPAVLPCSVAATFK